MKVFFVGLWVVLVALGATYGAAVMMPVPGAAKAEAQVHLEAQKTRVVSVPIIADGEPKGFITMQFNYTVVTDLMKSVKVPPEIYLIDDAFRTIYSDPSLDFAHLEKYDVNKFTTHLVQTVNDRLGVPVVKEILIDNFAFIPRDQKQ